MHPLRLLPERLPGLPPGGRPCLRPHLHRRHRHHPHGLVQRAEDHRGHPGPVHRLRQVQGDLSRQDRHPRADPRSSGAGWPRSRACPSSRRAPCKIINNRKVFHAMLRAASLGQIPFAKEGFIRHLPMFLSNLSEYRSLPTIAPVPFRDLFKKIQQPKGKTKVAFFSGCAIEFVFPKHRRRPGQGPEQGRHRGHLPRGSVLLRHPPLGQRRLRHGGPGRGPQHQAAPGERRRIRGGGLRHLRDGPEEGMAPHPQGRRHGEPRAGRREAGRQDRDVHGTGGQADRGQAPDPEGRAEAPECHLP